MIIIGTLECRDPRTGETRLFAAVSGSPAEAASVYERIRPHLDPAITLVPPVELPPKCKCVAPRLYAHVRGTPLVVHGMTLAEYGSGKKIKPCWWCRWHSNDVLAGVQTA